MTILKTMLRPKTEIFNFNSSDLYCYHYALTKFSGISKKNGVLELGISKCNTELLFSLGKFLCFQLSNKHLKYFLLSLFLALS
jgi:hypothetical protein